jgi:hypothetical protein
LYALSIHFKTTSFGLIIWFERTNPWFVPFRICLSIGVSFLIH